MKSIQTPIEAQRSRLERAKSVQAGVQRAIGFVEVTGAGESLVEVQFSVWFTERPWLSFGGELIENAVLKDKNFPTVSVVIKNWVTKTKNNATYYYGATLILVTGGTSDQKLVVHWQVEGMALVNPLLSSGATDDAI